MLSYIHTDLGGARPKRRFYEPYYVEDYRGLDPSYIPHTSLKDGEIEVLEDLLSLPDTKVEIFDGYVKIEEYIIPARYAENRKYLHLRSLLTGEPRTFCKWPNDYFGDKGRGPFSSFKKAVELGPISRNMRFDYGGKRI